MSSCEDDVLSIRKKLEKMIEGSKPQDEAADLVEALAGLPINYTVLNNTRIGLVMNDLLKKTTNDKLPKRIKQLIKDWKNIVESHNSGNGNGDKAELPKPAASFSAVAQFSGAFQPKSIEGDEVHQGTSDKYKSALRSRVFELRDKKSVEPRENVPTGTTVRMPVGLLAEATQDINTVKERELNLRNYKIPVIENMGLSQLAENAKLARRRADVIARAQALANSAKLPLTVEAIFDASARLYPELKFLYALTPAQITVMGKIRRRGQAMKKAAKEGAQRAVDKTDEDEGSEEEEEWNEETKQSVRQVGERSAQEEEDAIAKAIAASLSDAPKENEDEGRLGDVPPPLYPSFNSDSAERIKALDGYGDARLSAAELEKARRDRAAWQEERRAMEERRAALARSREATTPSSGVSSATNSPHSVAEGGGAVEVTSQEEEDAIAKAIAASLSDAPKENGGAKSSSLYPSAMNGGGRMESAPRLEKRAFALYDFEAAEDNELSLKTGDDIMITDDSNANWWRGRNERTRVEGLFPSSFVTTNPAEISAHKLAKHREAPIDELAAELEKNCVRGGSRVVNEEDKQKIRIRVDKRNFDRSPGSFANHRMVTEYSVTTDRRVINDRSNARYLCEENISDDVHFDLAQGLETFVDKAETLQTETCLLPLCKWACAQAGATVKEVFAGAEFAFWRGTLKHIAATLVNYNPMRAPKTEDAWTLVGQAFGGVILISEQSKGYEHERNHLPTYSGFKFEQYMVADAPGGRLVTDAPVDNRATFEMMVRSDLVVGGESLGVCCGAEVGALRGDEPIEFKTAWASEKGFFRTIAAVLQSEIVGVNSIVVGIKSGDIDKGDVVVNKVIEKKVTEMKAGGVGKTAVTCYSFLFTILGRMRAFLKLHEACEVTFDPVRGEVIIKAISRETAKENGNGVTDEFLHRFGL